MLIRLSQPSALFVSVDEVKAQAIIGTPDSPVTDDDTLIKAYIRAATRLVEERTSRILLPTEMEFRADCWREPIRIPAAPIRSVTEVAYLDGDHAEQALDAADWYEIATPEGADIRFTDAFGSPRR